MTVQVSICFKSILGLYSILQCIQTLMSSKADIAGLQALKAAIIDLQKRKQSRLSGVPKIQQLKPPETIKVLNYP